MESGKSYGNFHIAGFLKFLGPRGFVISTYKETILALHGTYNQNRKVQPSFIDVHTIRTLPSVISSGTRSASERQWLMAFMRPLLQIAH